MNLFYLTSGFTSLILLLLLVIFTHPSLFANIFYAPFFILIFTTILFSSRAKLKIKISFLNAIIITFLFFLAYLHQLTILNFLLLLSFWATYLYLHYRK